MSGPRRFAPLVAAALVFVACAQATAVAATTQDEVDEAKRAQDLAEARKAVAEAQAAEAKAKVGTLDTSKLSGPVGEAKTLNVEGSILAYTAVDRIAASIAQAVAPFAASGSGPRPIALLGDKDINALRQAGAFRQGVTQLNEAMSKFRAPGLAADDAQCAEPTTGGAAPLVLAGLDVALQVAQLFKVDRKLEGADVTLDDFALAAAVLARLQALPGPPKVVYGPTFTAGFFGGPDPVQASAIAKAVGEIGENQNKVDIQLAEIARRREKLKAREDDTKSKLPAACATAFDSARRTYTALETTGRNLKERADRFLAAAAVVDERTGVTVLQELVTAESLQKGLQNAYVLKLKPVSGGGTTYVRTSLFSTRIGVGGGAVVAWMLMDGGDGRVVASGTTAQYGGFVEPQDLGALLSSRPAGAAP
jgi:hypothetical protein